MMVKEKNGNEYSSKMPIEGLKMVNVGTGTHESRDHEQRIIDKGFKLMYSKDD